MKDGMKRDVTRRDFLTLSALGAGTVMATAALPTLGDPPPPLPPLPPSMQGNPPPPAFLKSLNGRNLSRMSIAYQHIHIGLPQPFSVLHISDTHLTACYPHEPPHKVEFAQRRLWGFGGRQEEALQQSLIWAKGNADLLIHTGDLIDFQTEANLDLVKRMFGESQPLAASMGNHEYQRRNPDEPIRTTTEYNDLSAEKLSAAYPFDISVQSTVVNGVNFVTMSQVYGFVTAQQVERFAAEVKKGLPIILCMHVPLFSEHIWRIHERYWPNRWKKFRAATLPDPRGDYKRQLEDPVTRGFVASLKKEPLLRGILTGHLHVTIQDRFSPTAMQYVVGGNYMYHGEEILFT
jgi:hypothetical protein